MLAVSLYILPSIIAMLLLLTMGFRLITCLFPMSERSSDRVSSSSHK